MAGRHIALLLALSVAGAAPVLGRDDGPAREGDLACSSLCRAWMGLGQTPEPVERRAVVVPAPIEDPIRRADVRAKPRTADKPRRAASAAVPVPPRRPVFASVQAPRVAAVDVPASAGVLPMAPSAEPPEHAAAMSRVAGEAAPVVAAETAPVVTAVAAEAAATTPSAGLPADAAATASLMPLAAAAPRSAPATPVGVRLGFYAVLAALVGWLFRPRSLPGVEAGPPAARRVRRRSARVAQHVPQHAAVDAL